MKRIKKVAALMLALITALAMSVTAFATDLENDDTGEDSKEVTRVYELYQIFTGTYVEGSGTLTNLKWGASTKSAGGEVLDPNIEELKNVLNGTDAEKLAVIETYLSTDAKPIATSTGGGSGDAFKDISFVGNSFTGLPAGYYLVKDVTNLSGTEESNNLSVVQVVDGTLSITDKKDIPKPDKKIVEGTNKVDVNNTSIGKPVNYEITGTLPSNYDAYDTYYYKFTDTLSKGLTYNKDISVKVGDEDLTLEANIVTTTKEDTGETVITVEFKNLKAEGLPKFSANSVIVITYSANLNKNAVIGGTGNPNKVELEFSNNPNDGRVHGKSPEKEVVTYTTELGILKTDKDGTTFLPGVEFTLYGEGVEGILVVTEENYVEDTEGTFYKLKNGTYTDKAPTEETEGEYESTETKYKKVETIVEKGEGQNDTQVIGIVDENGRVIFRGLGAGSYILRETKPLPGYNTIPDIEFTITGGLDGNGKYVFSSNNDNVVIGPNNTFETTIINTKDVQLPSTGGIGTTIFYVIGGILVVAAGILLVVKKRMQAE